jgi:hypothetical protein
MVVVPASAGGDLLFVLQTDNQWQLFAVDTVERSTYKLREAAADSVSAPAMADLSTLFYREHVLTANLQLCSGGDSSCAILVGIWEGWLSVLTILEQAPGQIDIDLRKSSDVLSVTGLNLAPRVVGIATWTTRQGRCGMDPMGNPAVAILYADDHLKVLNFRCVNIDINAARLLDGPWQLENVAPVELERGCTVLGLSELPGAGAVDPGVLLVSTADDATDGCCTVTYICEDGSNYVSTLIACETADSGAQQAPLAWGVSMGVPRDRRRILLLFSSTHIVLLDIMAVATESQLQLAVARLDSAQSKVADTCYDWLVYSGDNQVSAWSINGHGIGINLGLGDLEDAAQKSVCISSSLPHRQAANQRSGARAHAPPFDESARVFRSVNCSTTFPSLGARAMLSCANADTEILKLEPATSGDRDRSLACGCAAGYHGTLAVGELSCELSDRTDGEGPIVGGATRLMTLCARGKTDAGFVICSYDALRSTHVLDVSDADSWTAATIPGLFTDSPTLAITRAKDGSIVQITDTEVIRIADGRIVDQFKLAEKNDCEAGINAIGCALLDESANRILLSMGTTLFCGEMQLGWEESLGKGQFRCGDQISALASGLSGRLVAYSEWNTNRICMLDCAKSGSLKRREATVRATALPRALQFLPCEAGSNRLLVGLADGHLMCCATTEEGLACLHVVRVGQTPVSLTLFSRRIGWACILASSSHGLVVSASEDSGGGTGLQFSRLRTQARILSLVRLSGGEDSQQQSEPVGYSEQVVWISEPEPGAGEQRLHAGSLDFALRLRWRERQLHRTPVLIATHHASGLLLLVTEDHTRVGDGVAQPIAEWPHFIHALRAYDANSLEQCGFMEMKPGHVCTALHNLEGVLPPDCFALATSAVGTESVGDGLRLGAGVCMLSVLKLKATRPDAFSRQILHFELHSSYVVGQDLSSAINVMTPCHDRDEQPAVGIAYGKNIQILRVTVNRAAEGLTPQFTFTAITRKTLTAGSATSLTYTSGYFLASELQPRHSLFRWHDDTSRSPCLVIVATDSGPHCGSESLIICNTIRAGPVVGGGGGGVDAASSAGRRRRRRGMIVYAVVGHPTGGISVLKHAADQELDVSEVLPDDADEVRKSFVHIATTMY